ncbi:hypothetical protein [Staphylococcus saccharolyticus]|uniref:hypothetical protein n=1 Tax=Staphylococcus saccharolyticus TaxID=33028 RepID=UPI001933A45F|nr:hypothetical protein [Staphylococcus saccharolyticus]MBL7574002.1 hypothetical protein [Staphylococcus saccharolyticus]
MTTKNTISEKDDTPTTQERMSEQSTNSTHHQSPCTEALNADVSKQKATNKKLMMHQPRVLQIAK